MKHVRAKSALLSQLRWFVRLRWLAGATVAMGAGVDWAWLSWHSHALPMAGVGLFIIAYNILLWRWLQKPQESFDRHRLMLLVWVQLLLDMACLTLLLVWTGGVRSPLSGYLVFHMVFSSLLLSQRKAFASAAAALLILVGGLLVAGQWPVILADRLSLLGLCTTLLLTVYLANHITRGLRGQRRRLLKQNRRIRAITDQLHRTQQAMVQHEKMVSLGQMAAGVAHEVANPLASMDSLLQLMLRKPERVKLESLSTLREQIERINQIVRQMKVFAHPVETELESHALNDVVESALGMITMDPRWRTVTLERRFDPNAGKLWLAPHVLSQVLVNLAMNALDAMEKTENAKLTISTSRRNEWFVIEITDNGLGIAKENLDRLFEPFFTTKPVGKGTGLGLSISYSLIQRQGGSISVRSQPGVSTTFTVRLPADRDGSRMRETLAKVITTSENPST